MRVRMREVYKLLHWRGVQLDWVDRTPRNLADSLSVERFKHPIGGRWYRALIRFRKLRWDARVAAARRVLGPP